MHQRQLVDALSSFAARQRFDRTPDRVRALAKIHMVDSVAAILAGAAIPFLAGLHDLKDAGSADAIGAKKLVSPGEAAFLNALSGRASDIDDVQTTKKSLYGLLVEPSVPIFSAALAVGQARNVSGEALLTSYLVGVEIAARLAESVDHDILRRGYPTTVVCGGIGALFAAAKLAGLKRSAIHAAFRLWRTSIPARDELTGSIVERAWQEALSVRSAVEAVLLMSGNTAARAIPDSTPIMPGLTVPESLRAWGAPPAILDPGFALRALPGHPVMHPALDLLFAIVNFHDLRPDDIARVEIRLSEAAAALISFKKPTDDIGLRSNLPYAAATVVVHGYLSPASFHRRSTRRDIAALMSRIACRHDPALDIFGPTRAPAIVRVRLRNRRIVEMKTDVAKGSPQKPFSEIELFHKFFQHALPVFNEAGSERLLNRLWLIDEAPQINGLCALERPWPADSELGTRRGHDPHDHGREHHAHLGHDDHDHNSTPKLRQTRGSTAIHSTR